MASSISSHDKEPSWAISNGCKIEFSSLLSKVSTAVHVSTSLNLENIDRWSSVLRNISFAPGAVDNLASWSSSGSPDGSEVSISTPFNFEIISIRSLRAARINIRASDKLSVISLDTSPWWSTCSSWNSGPNFNSAAFSSSSGWWALPPLLLVTTVDVEMFIVHSGKSSDLTVLLSITPSCSRSILCQRLLSSRTLATCFWVACEPSARTSKRKEVRTASEHYILYFSGSAPMISALGLAGLSDYRRL